MDTIGTIVISPQEKDYEQFHWKIEEFSSLSELPGIHYNSPSFKFNDSSWHLKFFKGGESDKNRFCSLYLHVTSIDVPVVMHFKLGVKTLRGLIEEWFSSTKEFSSNNSVSDTGIAIPHSIFLSRKSELIPSDCLTIVITMSKAFPLLVHESQDVYFGDNDKNEEQQLLQKGREKALEDIGMLLSAGIMGDLFVRVQGELFEVHSRILAVRAPKLLRSFHINNMLQKAPTENIIHNCHPEVFRKFLHHLYTGTVQSLEPSIVFDLYRMAHRFSVADLKLLCLKKIQGILSVENFVRFFMLAMATDDEDLFKCIPAFSVENVWPIINSAEWKEFIGRCPAAANKILIEALRPMFALKTESLKKAS